MASRISLIVKSGNSNRLPYVLSILLLRASPSEDKEDRDVVEGECRGLSAGETDTKLVADESAVMLRCSAMRSGMAVEVIVSMSCTSTKGERQLQAQFSD